MKKTQLTIVTGASRGLGLAIAQQLLEQQHHVLCIARHTSSVLTQHAQAHGAGLEQWCCDLVAPDAVAQRLAQWLGQHHPQNWAGVTLINNAGVIPPIAPLAQSDAGELARALRVGLEAPMLLCSAFLRATTDWPLPRKVLNISSGLGRRAMASQAAYCAAKAGIDHFTRCMALDEALQPHGAKVCALAPGVIETDMQVQLRGSKVAAFPDQPAFAELHTSGRLLSPKAAAERVLAYLQSPGFGAHPVADVRA